MLLQMSRAKFVVFMLTDTRIAVSVQLGKQIRGFN